MFLVNKSWFVNKLPSQNVINFTDVQLKMYFYWILFSKYKVKEYKDTMYVQAVTDINEYSWWNAVVFGGFCLSFLNLFKL